MDGMKFFAVMLLVLFLPGCGTPNDASQPSAAPSTPAPVAATPDTPAAPEQEPVDPGHVPVEPDGVPSDLAAFGSALGLDVSAADLSGFGVGGCGPTGQEGPTEAIALSGSIPGDQDVAAQALVDMGVDVPSADENGLRVVSTTMGSGRPVEVRLHDGGVFLDAEYAADQPLGDIVVNYCD